MKYLLLIPCFTFGQISWEKFNNTHNDAVHFWAAFSVNELTYQVQSFTCPKWKESRKLLISSGITLGVIFAKEVYDKHKKHPTGFSKDDILNGSWSIPVYLIFNICRNDWKKRNDYSLQNKYLVY